MFCGRILNRGKFFFISGDEDHCFIDDAKALAKKLRDTEIKIIEKCGHICSIENWSSFNRIALEFLSLYKERTESKIGTLSIGS